MLCELIQFPEKVDTRWDRRSDDGDQTTEIRRQSPALPDGNKGEIGPGDISRRFGSGGIGQIEEEGVVGLFSLSPGRVFTGFLVVILAMVIDCGSDSHRGPVETSHQFFFFFFFLLGFFTFSSSDIYFPSWNVYKFSPCWLLMVLSGRWVIFFFWLLINYPSASLFRAH